MASSITHLSLTSNFSKLQKYPSFHISTTPTPRVHKIFSCLALDRTDENRSSPTRTSNDLRIMFSAGGTGGHIYPAVAIADDLKNLNPNIQILFVGTQNSMESNAITSSGYGFVSIPAFPLTRPLISPLNLLFPYLLIKSMIKSWEILSDFEPQIVVGTGGYVSAPICLTAALRGLNLVIQEQNSVPGYANWVLSRFADLIFVAFPSSVKYYPKNKKCIVSGNPVRLSLRRYVSKAVARLHFFPRAAKTWDSESKVVLVLGGSLGANAINIAILNMYHQMLLEHKNMFIIWQTGVEAFNEMESLVKNHPHLILTPFLHTMDMAYAAVDLVVSRAGAMTCSEILATGKPSILDQKTKKMIGCGREIDGLFLLDNALVPVALHSSFSTFQWHCRWRFSNIIGVRLCLLLVISSIVCLLLSLMIPSPNVAEGHQMKNASIMADLAGSKVITEDELDSTTLGIAIEEILGDASQMAEMCEKAMKAARPDASAEIAQHIISLVKLSTAKGK